MNKFSIFGSYWKDLMVHVGPGMISFFIIGTLYSSESYSLAFLFLTGIIYSLDCGHFFISAWRSYLKPDFGINKTVFWTSPFVILGLLFILFFYFSRWCHWPIIIYSVIHGYKQLHGVLRWYQAKQKHYENYTVICLRNAMYANMVAGLFDPDMMGFPDYRPPSSYIVHYLALSVLFGSLAYAVYREFTQADKSKINISKITFVVAVPLMFFTCVKFAVHYVQFELALLLAHCMQYYAVIYISQKAVDKTYDIPKYLFYAALTVLVGFTFFHFAPRQFDFYDIVFENRFYTWQDMSRSWKLALANAVAHVPIFLHFWLDGFVWTDKRNPELKAMFEESQAEVQAQNEIA